MKRVGIEPYREAEQPVAADGLLRSPPLNRSVSPCVAYSGGDIMP